jgi:hypothetical protein
VEEAQETKSSGERVPELARACAQRGDDVLDRLDLPLSCAPSRCAHVARSARSSSLGEMLLSSEDADARLDAGGGLDASGAAAADAS